MVEYRKGDRVKHPKRADWGIGEVLADQTNANVNVFFVGVGAKTISTSHVSLVPVSGADASHPVLDNLKVSKMTGGIRYQSLPQSIECFLEEYPNGFRGEVYENAEREYKVKAQKLAQELLGQSAMEELLSAGDYEEICVRALQVVNATNLIFPNEKMALKDGLEVDGARRKFAESLFDFLYGEGNLQERFEGFSKCLEDMDAAKWTTVSYFPFLLHAENVMFVKPMVTQYAAELCGFEINYKPALNWLTYKSVLTFSEYLRKELSELKPRDMIDIQSFMWCIAPHD